MNNYLYHIILGVVQGLTEFLPVSSSAHLVFAQNLFGVKEPQIFFDVVLHLGTLCAVVVFFRKDIFNMAKSIFKVKSEEFRFILIICAGTIPAAFFGFLFEDYFEKLFRSPIYPSLFLVITGIVLFLTKYKKDDNRRVNAFSFKDAVVIGFAQAFAIAPGLSRSGMTVSAGIFRGLDRKLCAKYSMLLSIPIILGAAASQAKDMNGFSGIFTFPVFLGFLAAFIVGIFAIKVLIKLLEKAKFYYFSYYCLAAGIITFIYFTVRQNLIYSVKFLTYNFYPA